MSDRNDGLANQQAVDAVDLRSSALLVRAVQLSRLAASIYSSIARERDSLTGLSGPGEGSLQLPTSTEDCSPK